MHVDPADAQAGASRTLAFSSSHGCDGSPTSAIVIDIPDAVATTTPVAQGGWAIERELGDAEQPTRVTFTPDDPIESGIQASVALVVAFSEDAAHTDVAFPVTQECLGGSTAWVETADEGQDPESLDAPAPVVAVGDVAPAGELGHGDAAASDDDALAAGSAEDHAEASGSTADPVARWLAGGAPLAGIAALVVVLVRGRRKA